MSFEWPSRLGRADEGEVTQVFAPWKAGREGIPEGPVRPHPAPDPCLAKWAGEVCIPNRCTPWVQASASGYSDRPWLTSHDRILRLFPHVVNQRFSLVHNAVSWTSPELVRSIDDAVELLPGNGVLRRGERKRGDDDAERTANQRRDRSGSGAAER